MRLLTRHSKAGRLPGDRSWDSVNDRLRGYSLPFSPSGRASLLPEPPYHTGRLAVAIHFRADPERVAAFIPDPLTPGPTSDQGFVMFLDHVMPGDRLARDGGPLNEAQTTFREVMLGIPCELDGVPTTLLAATWVDRDWAVIMGWLWGSPARLADIQMTRYDPWNAFVPGPAIGQEIRLQAERYGELVMRGSVTIDRQGSDDEPFFRTIRRERQNRRHVVGIRYLPDLSQPAGPPLVYQITTEEHEDTRAGDIWSGDATLEFGDTQLEDLSALGPIEPIGGHVTTGGFTSGGLTVLHDYRQAATDSAPRRDR